jgi:hypothetical protein
LVARVADALEYAHAQGVLHRDVKPANILIDDSGQPHLTDFGLARRAGAEPTLTLDGQVIGTPAYIPPEQVSGKSDVWDARADVYSLGVVLYEMLTGALPFHGSLVTLLHETVHVRPLSPRRMKNSIPRELDRIALKCLAKEPHRRYATAADLAADLRGWLRADTRVPAPRRVADTRRRRSLAAVMGLVAVVAALLLLLPGTDPLFLWRRTLGGEPSQLPSHTTTLIEPHQVTVQHASATAQPELSQAHQPAANAAATGLRSQVQVIDDFEGGAGGWERYIHGPKNPQLKFKTDQMVRHRGTASLAIAYDMMPGDSGLCSLVFSDPRDWSDFQGLRLFLRSEQAGQEVTIVAYGGNSLEELIHFAYHLKTAEAAVAGWQCVDVLWDELRVVDWQDDGVTEFDPQSSRGVALCFDASGSESVAGRIWIDDVTLVPVPISAGSSGG